MVQTGDTVAIFGAGPAGLLATMSAMLKGASEVYVVDQVKDRLAKAQELGGIPIDFSQGDPVQQIKEHRRANKLQQAALRPGETKMDGVMCGIDAVGYEALADDDPRKQNPT